MACVTLAHSVMPVKTETGGLACFDDLFSNLELYMNFKDSRLGLTQLNQIIQ